MNNENIVRIRIALGMALVTLLTLVFGVSPASALHAKQLIAYNENVIYLSKYVNLVTVKDVIHLKYTQSNKKVKVKTLYLIRDVIHKNTFLMPAYSKVLKINSRVDNRVIISRLANALKSQETGGEGAYLRKSYSSSACGAYQYMQSTWNDYMGYRTPCSAPAWVQDSRMVGELQASYNKYHSWEKAVAAHLSPAYAGDKRLWNRRISGNPTVREYVNSVFSKANIALA